MLGDLGSDTKEGVAPMQQRIAGIAMVKDEQAQPSGVGQAFEQLPTADDILLVGRMNQRAQHPALGIDRQLAFAAFAAFVTIYATGPLFSAVWTDWLSTSTTLGAASRSSCNRTWIRKASFSRDSTPWATNRRQKAYTASHGGRSCGSIRHWQPVRVRYSSALSISRRACTGLRPRVSCGSRGSTMAHCSSVRSVG